MPFVRCTKTDCSHHAQKHFKRLKRNDLLRCYAPALALKRRDKQHLVFDCLLDPRQVVESFLRKREERR